jgi:hypothetical protein
MMMDTVGIGQKYRLGVKGEIPIIKSCLSADRFQIPKMGGEIPIIKFQKGKGKFQ